MVQSSRPTTWRNRLIAATVVPALLVAPACGRLRRHFSGGSPARSGTLVVSPPSGPAGTKFVLSAGGFRPSEPMTFEIDLPNHTRFVGQVHVAGPDGRVTSTYNPSIGDPAGPYQVKAVGSRGTRASARLTLVAASPPTT